MQKQAAEIISLYGGEVREEYSGRSMYGAATCGIVFDSEEDFLKAIGTIMDDCDEDECPIVGRALQKLKRDSMGTGVIYY